MRRLLIERDYRDGHRITGYTPSDNASRWTESAVKLVLTVLCVGLWGFVAIMLATG